MQAIILAAGLGKRLGDYTKNNTKCMVKVNDQTLIERVLLQLSKLEISRVVIVIGYKGQKLKEYINSKDFGIKIEYVENPIYNQTNNIYSLALAKQQLQEDDTILIESDLIFDDSLLSLLINNPFPNLALVAKYESWMDGTMARIDNENNITGLITKKAFKYSEVEHYYKTLNVYKFSKEFSRDSYVPFLEAYCKAMGNNDYYEQVLKVLTLLDRVNIKALPIKDEKWYEIDDIQDLDIAETIFANEENQLPLFQKRYGGYWRFPKLLDYCYLVNPFFPPPKLKEEIKSNFDILLSEYPSGMRINSLLMAKYFNLKQEYVCVGNGAAELIKALMGKLIGKVGMIFPTFEEYPNRYNTNETEIFIPDNPDFSYSVSDIINHFENKVISTLLLINPDNPSGNYISKSDVISLAKWCSYKNIRFVVDESFVDFTDDFQNNTLLKNQILKENPNLVVIKSISKSYGVPGLRLGGLMSSDTNLINEIKKEVTIWNINSFAEFYMQIFGKYDSDYKESCKLFINERERFYNDLLQIAWLRVVPSQANYFLCEVLNKFTSTELMRILLIKHSIFIKDCSTKVGFNGKNYIRIAVRGKTDNEKLFNELKEM
jgi:histidinol-phosphate/aromatic aminotransferase/cobyric acid decarboxylase-like protein/GTP:adenosylcobinamide-phosphate guanylyltransferase